MFPTLKTKTRWLAVALVLSTPFLLSTVLTGCGRNEGSDTQHTAFRAGSTRSASDVTTPGSHPIDTMPAPVESAQMALAPEPPREVTYEEAEASYFEGDYAKAAELFTRYTERKSGNPWGYYMLGLSARKAGDTECAEEAFEQALALDSLHVKSYLNLSRVLLDAHRPKDALQKIDRALAIDPESNVAYRLRGRALRQQGQLEDAIVAYQRALALDDEDAWAMNNLALILIESELFEKALPPLACAVELDGGIAIFWNNLGMALEGAGRFRAAEDAYQSAVDVDPSYFKASMNLSRVASVQEEPGLVPVDLGAVARAFVDEIAGWKKEVVVHAEPGIMGPVPGPSRADADSIVVRGTPVLGAGERP